MQRVGSLVFFLYAPIILSGCDWWNNDDNKSDVNAVIEGAQTVCDYVPAAANIATLLAPATATVNVVVSQICAEIDQIPLLEAGEEAREVTIEVNGVEISGILDRS